eukprot:TRINITY_DN43686_c0_g1_i1.p1 TRINITY_DN43686_c0_g1~~TRINITY_DN43686_c0_g1_i1.p1  ORF type:complete len:258 (+),score=43.00 TRINITY_DN43686_c0_g1_i1:63-776(+)
MDHIDGDPNEFWKKELSGPNGEKSWYAKGEAYWDNQEASVNGVLGGFGCTSEPDVRESKQFLQDLCKDAVPPSFRNALDVGAGIGRISSMLLLPQFQRVDLLEQNARLLDAAREQFKDEARVERFLCEPLQTFTPEPRRYDMIWIQGVLLYLPDNDLVASLRRCRQALADETAVICLKENVVLRGSTWFCDREDNSVTRTDCHFKSLFKQAGLRIMHEALQQDWPEDLLPCKMYALR